MFHLTVLQLYKNPFVHPEGFQFNTQGDAMWCSEQVYHDPRLLLYQKINTQLIEGRGGVCQLHFLVNQPMLDASNTLQHPLQPKTYESEFKKCYALCAQIRWHECTYLYVGVAIRP